MAVKVAPTTTIERPVIARPGFVQGGGRCESGSLGPFWRSAGYFRSSPQSGLFQCRSACLKRARNGPGDPNAPLLFTDPKLTAMPRKSHSAVSAQDRLVRPSVRLLQTKVARQPEGRRPKEGMIPLKDSSVSEMRTLMTGLMFGESPR